VTKTWWVAGVVVVVAAVALFRPAAPAAAAPPEELKFARDKALKVTRRQAGEPLFLSSPGTVRIGDRAFLSGWKVGADVAVYIPVSDVELIEEYPSAEALRKAWNLPAGPAAGAATTTEKK
jgi:hypothetical protein